MSNPYKHAFLPAQDNEGNHIFSMLAKRTYSFGLGGELEPAEEQLPLVGADEFYDNGDAVSASCRMESDYVPFKIATDVVFIGNVHSRNGKPATVVEASLSVGETSKTLYAIGDRQCSYVRYRGVQFPDPDPFTEMEVRYERAYGGVDLHTHGQDAPMMYPRNPLGKGFVIEEDHEVLDGLELPNLEDPDHLLAPDRLILGDMRQWQKQPMPQGFGWYGKLWYPRCTFAGALPAHMDLYEEVEEAAMGLIPEDQVEQFKRLQMPMMDYKYFNGAAPGLATSHLTGGEVIQLRNLTPGGSLDIRLPEPPPHISIDIGDGPQEPDEVVLHTVCILGEEQLVYLVWRGCVSYPGPQSLQELKELDIVVEAQ